VVLEKDGYDQLDRTCEKRRSVTRVKEERNTLQTITSRKNYWIFHILSRKCLLKYVIEGKIESLITVAEGRKRRYKQLLDDLTG